MRLLLVFLGLGVVFTIPFLLWGERFEATFSTDGAVTWLRGYERWAWAAAIGLLVADLVLPVPSTPLISALGLVYGPVVGGLIGAAGSFLAGSVAYGACRLLGDRAARWLAGSDLARGERFLERFGHFGAWAVVVSRWMPLLPEVVACLAGLVRMPPARFFLALGCGSLPMAFVFAAVGHAGTSRPLLAITLSAVIPVVLWLAARPLLGWETRESAAASQRREAP